MELLALIEGVEINPDNTAKVVINEKTGTVVIGQGVKVSKKESGWVCEAHGSEFESDGDLVLGPATTRLPRVPMKISKGVATVG